MDNLKFATTWGSNIQGAAITIKIRGMLLEGCAFDGHKLTENQRDSPSFTEIPPCSVAWIKKV